MPSSRKESVPKDYLPNPKLLQNREGVEFMGTQEALKHDINVESAKLTDPEEPELLANNPQKRNWRGIILALFVILVISSLIITASILTTPKEQAEYYGETLTFSDLVQLNRHLKTLNYQLIGNQLLYLSDEYDLIHINLSTMEQKVILHHMTIKEKTLFIGKFSITPDLSGIILQYDARKENRHSYMAKYDALLLPRDKDDVEKRIEVGRSIDSQEQPFLSFVQQSPRNYHLAYPHNRHVYIHLFPFDSERSTIINVTQDLPDHDIQYGLTDWVYEEEIFETNVAVWWNPSGTRLAFVSFDERNVRMMKIYRYDIEGAPFGDAITHKYPKADDAAPYGPPIVQLFIYDIDRRERRAFDRPGPVPADGYLVFVQWFDDDTLIACWSNRIQTEAWITVVSWTRNTSYVIYRTYESNGWVDVNKQSSKEPLVNQRSKSLFIILPRDYSPEGYRGIARLIVDQKGVNIEQSVRWMITPNFDIVDILHFDGRDAFLFRATGPDPKQMHIYWGSISGELYCLTCDNPNCTFGQAEVSKNGKYFLHHCQGPDVPTFKLRAINVTRNESEKRTVQSHPVLTLQDNEDLRKRVQSLAFPRTEFINLTLREGTRDSLQVEAKVLLPPELNRTHITKYPLMLSTYGGPRKQLVTTQFLPDWSAFLAATVKVIVLHVDGRGTGGRGRRFEHRIYKKLGVVEVEDQLSAVEAFVKSFGMINETQIGAFGWSYGGFTVGHLMGHPDNKLIRCGAMVAPVTDFKLYDVVYTERYLGKVVDNPDAYMQTAIARLAKNMRSKSLLLIHGTADDNVHMMHSMVLTKALLEANVDVDVMLYPDAKHSIRHREHVYRKIITFMVDCFNQTSIRHSLDMNVHADL